MIVVVTSDDLFAQRFADGEERRDHHTGKAATTSIEVSPQLICQRACLATSSVGHGVAYTANPGMRLWATLHSLRQGLRS